MNLNSIKNAYFLGIGGIGMSAIARYFKTIGVNVAGYDKTETPLTKELINEGIAIHYTDDISIMKNYLGNTSDTLVVLTPAIPASHNEWNELQKSGYTILKRSKVLGLITDAYNTIGVAGTHGKTTTSTLIAHLFKQSSIDCAAFLGGISTNYQTNLLLNNSNKEKLEQWMVVEADEFDRSFLTLHPHTGIITSTDADHLDIYGEHDALKESFTDYALQVSKNLIVKKELEHFNQFDNKITYSIISKADFYADNIRICGDQYFFDLYYSKGVIENLFLGIPGLHNVENATAACAAALLAGMNETELRKGLETFSGVKRRFEYLLRDEKIIYIDDYAHHPTEIKAILSSVKQMYPSRKLTVVFQPHLFTRTRDFADGFAESLDLADELFMMEIYPARELPIEGVNSQMILGKMKKKGILVKENEVINKLTDLDRNLIVTIGAGDIDRITQPLKSALENKYLINKS